MSDQRTMSIPMAHLEDDAARGPTVKALRWLADQVEAGTANLEVSMEFFVTGDPCSKWLISGVAKGTLPHEIAHPESDPS